MNTPETYQLMTFNTETMSLVLTFIDLNRMKGLDHSVTTRLLYIANVKHHERCRTSAVKNILFSILVEKKSQLYFPIL